MTLSSVYSAISSQATQYMWIPVEHLTVSKPTTVNDMLKYPIIKINLLPN